jgi:hypothetical protein
MGQHIRRLLAIVRTRTGAGVGCCLDTPEPQRNTQVEWKPKELTKGRIGIWI